MPISLNRCEGFEIKFGDGSVKGTVLNTKMKYTFPPLWLWHQSTFQVSLNSGEEDVLFVKVFVLKNEIRNNLKQNGAIVYGINSLHL